MITYFCKKINTKGDLIIEKVIYGDVLMVINFSMDFLALYVTAKIMHLKPKHKLLTLSALLGAVYSLAVLALGLNGILGGIISLSAAFLLTFTAYGKQKPSALLKNTAVFYIVSFALGGGITAICNLLNFWQNRRGIVINGTFDVIYGDLPFGLLLILSAVCGLFSLITGRLIKRNVAKRVCSLCITLNGSTATISALVDSGNLLREPISEKAVIIASFGAVRSIIPVELLTLFKNKDISGLEDSPYRSRIRLIPASTVNGQGLLFGISPDRVTADGKEVDVYVALSSDALDFGGYQAIVPAVIIN